MAVVVIWPAAPAFAADVTYIGTAAGDRWDMGTSWSGGVMPGKDDRAIIGAGTANINMPSTPPDMLDIGSVWFTSASSLTAIRNESMPAMRFYGVDGIAVLNESDKNIQIFRKTLLENDLTFRASNAAGGGLAWGFFGGSGPLSGINLNGHTATFDTVNAANTMSFSSGFLIQGTGNIIKTGLGTLRISNVSKYDGSTTIDNGTLALTGSGSIASSSGLHNDGLFDITGISSSTSIKALSGSGVVDVGTKSLTLTDAHDTFTGTFSGSGALTLASGTETLTGDSSAFTGLTTVQAGMLSVNGKLGGTMNVDAGGRLQGIGSVGDTTLAASGTIAPGNSIGILTVLGNYTGNGGMLEIESVLGGDTSPSDRLVVTGNTSGATNVKVTNLGGSGAPTTNGIKIVDVGGVSSGAFSLLGHYDFHGEQAVIAGAYAYTLQKDGVTTPADGDWYLRSSLINPPPVAPSGPIYQPGVPLYEVLPQVLLGLNALPTLQQRVGNRYWDAGAVNASRAPSGDQPDGGEHGMAWGRAEGSYGRSTPSNSVTVSNARIGQWAARTGVDALLHDGEEGLLIGGVNGHYGQALGRVRSPYGDGRIDTSGYGFSGTLTWYGANGFYVDGQAQHTWFDSDLESELVSGNMASGVDGSGYALSVETGKRFGIIGPWTLTPQAQLAYSKVDSDFADNFGARVSLDRSDSLTGRLGLALDHQQSWRDQSGTLVRSNIYGITNLYYEFRGGTSVDVAGTGFASEYERLAAGIGLGGTYSWDDEKYSIYGEALVKTSFDDEYSVGGNVGLRVRW